VDIFKLLFKLPNRGGIYLLRFLMEKAKTMKLYTQYL